MCVYCCPPPRGQCCVVCVCVCVLAVHACSACSHGEVGSAVLEERSEGGEEVFSPWLWCWRGGEGCIGYGEWVLWRVPEGLSGVEGVGEGKESGPASHPYETSLSPSLPRVIRVIKMTEHLRQNGGLSGATNSQRSSRKRMVLGAAPFVLLLHCRSSATPAAAPYLDLCTPCLRCCSPLPLTTPIQLSCFSSSAVSSSFLLQTITSRGGGI